MTKRVVRIRRRCYLPCCRRFVNSRSYLCYRVFFYVFVELFFFAEKTKKQKLNEERLCCCVNRFSQIRLTLAKKDFVRALIQSRKINRKVLLDEDMQDIKVGVFVRGGGPGTGCLDGEEGGVSVTGSCLQHAVQTLKSSEMGTDSPNTTHSWVYDMGYCIIYLEVRIEYSYGVYRKVDGRLVWCVCVCVLCLCVCCSIVLV